MVAKSPDVSLHINTNMVQIAKAQIIVCPVAIESISKKKKNYIDVQADMGLYCSGPSCSKLTMSLVNDSLKFTSSDTQIC